MALVYNIIVTSPGDCLGENRKKLLLEKDFFCIMKLIRSAAVQRRPRQLPKEPEKKVSREFILP